MPTTATCPASHTQLASSSAGKPYGHVPGHQYHDVDVVVSHCGDDHRVHVVESWGSAQGYDEEHGRREAIGRGGTIREAISDARDRAKSAGIESEYLEQALSLAEDEALQAAGAEPNEQPAKRSRRVIRDLTPDEQARLDRARGDAEEWRPIRQLERALPRQGVDLPLPAGGESGEEITLWAESATDTAFPLAVNLTIQSHNVQTVLTLCTLELVDGWIAHLSEVRDAIVRVRDGAIIV